MTMRNLKDYNKTIAILIQDALHYADIMHSPVAYIENTGEFVVELSDAQEQLRFTLSANRDDTRMQIGYWDSVRAVCSPRGPWLSNPDSINLSRQISNFLLSLNARAYGANLARRYTQYAGRLFNALKMGTPRCTNKTIILDAPLVFEGTIDNHPARLVISAYSTLSDVRIGFGIHNNEGREFCVMISGSNIPQDVGMIKNLLTRIHTYAGM